MGWIKRSRRKVESIIIIIIPVCLSLLSFQYSTGYSSICRRQETDAEDPSPKTEGDGHINNAVLVLRTTPGLRR